MTYEINSSTSEYHDMVGKLAPMVLFPPSTYSGPLTSNLVTWDLIQNT